MLLTLLYFFDNQANSKSMVKYIFFLHLDSEFVTAPLRISEYVNANNDTNMGCLHILKQGRFCFN